VVSFIDGGNKLQYLEKTHKHAANHRLDHHMSTPS